MTKVKIVIEDGVITSFRSDKPEELDVEVFYLDTDADTYEEDDARIDKMIDDDAYQPVRYREPDQDSDDM